MKKGSKSELSAKEKEQLSSDLSLDVANRSEKLQDAFKTNEKVDTARVKQTSELKDANGFYENRIDAETANQYLFVVSEEKTSRGSLARLCDFRRRLADKRNSLLTDIFAISIQSKTGKVTRIIIIFGLIIIVVGGVGYETYRFYEEMKLRGFFPEGMALLLSGLLALSSVFLGSLMVSLRSLRKWIGFGFLSMITFAFSSYFSLIESKTYLECLTENRSLQACGETRGFISDLEMLAGISFSATSAIISTMFEKVSAKIDQVRGYLKSLGMFRVIRDSERKRLLQEVETTFYTN